MFCLLFNVIVKKMEKFSCTSYIIYPIIKFKYLMLEFPNGCINYNFKKPKQKIVQKNLKLNHLYEFFLALILSFNLYRKNHPS